MLVLRNLRKVQMLPLFHIDWYVEVELLLKLENGPFTCAKLGDVVVWGCPLLQIAPWGRVCKLILMSCFIDCLFVFDLGLNG